MALTKIDDRGLKTPIDLLDNEKIRFGTGNDIEFYHDGSNSKITHGGSGGLYIGSDAFALQKGDHSENYISMSANGAVELFHDNSRRLHTAAEGIKVFGPADNNCDVILWADNGADWTDGVRLRVADAGPFTISGYNNSGTAETFIEANINGAVELYYDGVKKFETSSNGVHIGTDSGRLFFTNPDGFSPNLRENAGGLEFWTNNGKRMTLEHGGNLVFEDNRQVQFGGGMDLQIKHDGTNSSIKNLTGHLILQSDSFKVTNNGDTESIIRGTANGNVELYYDNSKKLETETTGAKVTGMLGVNVTPDTSASSTYTLQLKGSTQCYMSIGNDTTGVGISNGLIIGNDATDVYIYNREDTPIVFGVNGVNKFIMKTGGQFQIIDGDLQLASGHGIDFSATSDATGKSSELLNDYEEGTWTPNFYGTSGDDSWTNGCAGSYTKIGNQVTVRWSAQNYSGNVGGAVSIGGLPYSNNFRQYGGDFGIYDVNAPSNTIGRMIYFPTGSVMYLYWEVDNDGGPQIQGSELNSGAYIEGNFTYRTA